MKYILMVSLIVFNLSINSCLYASPRYSSPIQCSQNLQPYLQTIQSFDGGKDLISNVLKGGPIRLVSSSSTIARQFGAYWDPDERIIVICLGAHRSKEEIVGSIIFELHNALNNSKLQRIYQLALQGRIDKARYVRDIEYIEYQNSIQAAKLIREGISKKIVNENAQLYVYDTFDEYLYHQRLSGHSAVIAESYKEFAPRG